MSFERIAIIGVNCISVSMALGLKRQKSSPEIVGYDAEKLAADLSRSMGAFDWVERKLGQACRGADLVIVAEPLPKIPETFKAIAQHLKPDCFVTDIAPLKVPVMEWADSFLPQSVSFIGGHPIPNPAIVGFTSLEGLDEASEDLLVEALYLFTAPSKPCKPDAIAELATALDAHPYFIDATEHDGLHAGVEGLPALLAAALLQATVGTSGWEEMRKLAGTHFAAATKPAQASPEQVAAVLHNRENILLRLNVLLKELLRLRDVLSEDKGEVLEELFSITGEGRERWMHERERGMWTQERPLTRENLPNLSEQFSQMLFGESISRRLRRRPGKKEDQERT